ncbi:MAG: YHS domain-containing protein [Pirellulales bacterium]|nr:YHS domain-containing protein [Pirellulales bacterium]
MRGRRVAALVVGLVERRGQDLCQSRFPFSLLRRQHMAVLEQFSRQIQARLAAAGREPHWQPSDVADFMATLAPRRRDFEEVAPRLVRDIIRPRMEALVAQFPNAKCDRAEDAYRCTCWFGYRERFPTDARVELAVEHDERIENLVIRYELSMLPVFLKFEPHDKLTAPLVAVDDRIVADWVEAKLLNFLDTYLRLDRGQDDFEDEVVIDPVCGMRISRSSAGARTDYKGHSYFFCTDDCRRQFEEEPLRYVRFEVA